MINFKLKSNSLVKTDMVSDRKEKEPNIKLTSQLMDFELQIMLLQKNIAFRTGLSWLFSVTITGRCWVMGISKFSKKV